LSESFSLPHLPNAVKPLLTGTQIKTEIDQFALLTGGITDTSSAALRLAQCDPTEPEMLQKQKHLNNRLDSKVGCNEWLGGHAWRVKSS